MSYEDWVARYSPVFEDAEQSSLVQYPTWTSLPEEARPYNGWAVIEGDDGCEHDDDCDCEPPAWAIFPGYHLVNVVYYAVTEKPWSEQDPIDYVIWD